MQGCKKKEPTLATITLGAITEITDATAKVEFTVTSDGYSPIIERGVRISDRGCVSCESSSIKFTTTGTTGKGIITLTGLKKATQYTVGAYAINGIGINYSNTNTFNTSATVPTLLIDIENINPIMATTAVLPSYRISDDGGSTAFTRGVCWSTNANPTIADFRTTDTIINKVYGGFFSTLLNLKPNTKYFLRPYAINAIGVGYGKELSFTTNGNFSCLPNAIEPESSIMQILPTSNGKFMLLGSFQKVNGFNHLNSVALNSDGSIDNSYSAKNTDYNILNLFLNNATFLPNGKIILPARNNTTARNTVIRLNANGSMDNSFTIPSGTSSTIVKTIVMPDGKIILAGRFAEFNGVSANRIVKLNADGTLDGSFAFNPSFSLTGLNTATLLNNGNILIQVSLTNGFQNYVLKADGSFDTGSNLHNSLTPNVVLIPLRNNQLLVMNATSVLSRLNADGSVDNSYKSYKFATSPTENSSYIAHEISGGKIILGVNSRIGTKSVFTIYRLNNDGTPDVSFGSNGSGGLEFRDGSLSTITTSSDGKIFVGGNFTAFMDRFARHFMVLNANGSMCN